jgi:hypothetical protein
MLVGPFTVPLELLAPLDPLLDARPELLVLVPPLDGSTSPVSGPPVQAIPVPIAPAIATAKSPLPVILFMPESYQRSARGPSTLSWNTKYGGTHTPRAPTDRAHA